MALGTRDLPEPRPNLTPDKLFKPVSDGSAALGNVVKAGMNFADKLDERQDEKVLSELDQQIGSVFQDPNETGAGTDPNLETADNLEEQLKGDPDGRSFVRDMDRLNAKRTQGRNARGDLDRVQAIVREMTNKHPGRADIIEAYARKKYNLDVGVESQVKQAQDAVAFQDKIGESIVRGNVMKAQEQGLYFADENGKPDIDKMNAAGAAYTEWSRKNENGGKGKGGGSGSAGAGLSQTAQIDLETREARIRGLDWFELQAASLESGLNTLIPQGEGDTRSLEEIQGQSVLMRGNLAQVRAKIPELRSELTRAKFEDGTFQFSKEAVDSSIELVEAQLADMEQATEFTATELKQGVDFRKDLRSLETETKYKDFLMYKETGMWDLVIAQNATAVKELLTKTGIADDIENSMLSAATGQRKVTASQALYNITAISDGSSPGIPSLPAEEQPVTEALNVTALLNGAKMPMQDMKPEMQNAWLNNYDANNVNIATKANISDARNGMFLYDAPGVQDKLVQFIQQSQNPEQTRAAKSLAGDAVSTIAAKMPLISGKMLMDIDPKVARYVYNPDTGRVEIEAVAPYTMRRVRQSRAQGDVRQKTQEIQFQRINPAIPTVIRETKTLRTQDLVNMDALNAGMSAMMKLKPVTNQAGISDKQLAEYYFVNLIGLPIMGGPRDGFFEEGGKVNEQAAEFFGPQQQQEQPTPPVNAIRLVRDPDTGFLVEAEE